MALPHYMSQGAMIRDLEQFTFQFPSRDEKMCNKAWGAQRRVKGRSEVSVLCQATRMTSRARRPVDWVGKGSQRAGGADPVYQMRAWGF